MIWFDVIGSLAAVGLLVVIPMEIVELRKNKKAILESNRKRISAMETHKEAMKAHGDSLRRFTDLHEQQKRKEDE